MILLFYLKYCVDLKQVLKNKYIYLNFILVKTALSFCKENSRQKINKCPKTKVDF